MSDMTVKKILSINSDALTDELAAKVEKLHLIISEMEKVVVAYSGGVDSTFLLKAAVEVLGDNALAVTGDSESIPRSELDNSIQMAVGMNAKHRVVKTDEMNDPEYVINDANRCYHCKKTLFGTLSKLAEAENYNFVIEGSNFDDLSDYRPGMKAVDKFSVRSPLKDAGLTKEEIRTLSQQLDLPTWDKPAAPCLSSRIPYGFEVTIEKLKRIETAEKFLRGLGLTVLRVRDHGDVARIEVPKEAVNILLDGEAPEQVTDYFKSLGYKFVAMDLLGFRSGSLNEVLNLDNDE